MTTPPGTEDFRTSRAKWGRDSLASSTSTPGLSLGRGWKKRAKSRVTSKLNLVVVGPKGVGKSRYADRERRLSEGIMRQFDTALHRLAGSGWGEQIINRFEQHPIITHRSWSPCPGGWTDHKNIIENLECHKRCLRTNVSSIDRYTRSGSWGRPSRGERKGTGTCGSGDDGGREVWRGDEGRKQDHSEGY